MRKKKTCPQPLCIGFNAISPACPRKPGVPYVFSNICHISKPRLSLLGGSHSLHTQLVTEGLSIRQGERADHLMDARSAANKDHDPREIRKALCPQILNPISFTIITPAKKKPLFLCLLRVDIPLITGSIILSQN